MKPETECIVCQRMFEKDLIVALKTKEEDFALQRAEDMICSKECKKIFSEAWSNKESNCNLCGKKLEEKNIVAWNDDYENKVVKPICESCL